MPRISVVVPIYDVEHYLGTCLQSLARQSTGDLEVIMVDDGSTDGSRALAERFAAADRRFRLIAQPNGGLGRARNAGAAQACGEFLAFVDSDDVVPADAYARLLASLDATGSDFASGNVQRLTRQGAAQAQFLSRTFARTRLKTHVTRFRPLLADRTAWNKLFRRSFWDAQDLAFPEGVVHEDIPVTLPAHLAAGSVDVIAAPVYQWRVREDGAPSITQRRLEPKVLSDRFTAIEHVLAHFADHGSRRLCRWYLASVVADDLRLHLELLVEADDGYRAIFMERAGALLRDAPERVISRLPAIDRLKWRLVRRGLLPELLDVLRFERQERHSTPVLRARGRYYGDFPHRTNRRLGIPASTYRLGRRDEDLGLTAQLDAVRPEDGALRLHGHAYIGGLGAHAGHGQQTTLVALRSGRWRALRLRMAALRLPTAPARRSDLAPRLAWAGFEAKLDGRALQRRGRWEDGTWDLYACTRAGGVRRRRGRFALASPELLGAIDLPGAQDARLRLAITAEGGLSVEVRTRWAECELARVTNGVLELAGTWRGLDPAAELVLRRRSDALSRSVAADLVGGRFSARISLAGLATVKPSLEAVAAPGAGSHEMWDLTLGATAIGLPEARDGMGWRLGRDEMTLVRTRRGDTALVTRRLGVPQVPVSTPQAPVAAAP